MIWIFISIVGLVTLLAVVFMWKLGKKRWKHETDYRAFFYIGLVWFPMGVALDFPFFYILGLVYLGIGLANKDKWGKTKPLTPEQIRWKKIVLGTAAALLVAGVAAFMLFV